MSYECDICKCISCPSFEGSLRQLGFHKCIRGHTICNQCWYKYDEDVDDSSCESSSADDDDDSPEDETMCPLCSFTDISDDDMIRTCYKVLDMKKLKEILLSSFNNKHDFNKWVNYGDPHKIQKILKIQK
jgi:hypothetical protein